MIGAMLLTDGIFEGRSSILGLNLEASHQDCSLFAFYTDLVVTVKY